MISFKSNHQCISSSQDGKISYKFYIYIKEMYSDRFINAECKAFFYVVKTTKLGMNVLISAAVIVL
jgi:hypothetical protein